MLSQDEVENGLGPWWCSSSFKDIDVFGNLGELISGLIRWWTDEGGWFPIIYLSKTFHNLPESESVRRPRFHGKVGGWHREPPRRFWRHCSWRRQLAESWNKNNCRKNEWIRRSMQRKINQWAHRSELRSFSLSYDTICHMDSIIFRPILASLCDNITKTVTVYTFIPHSTRRGTTEERSVNTPREKVAI